MDARVAVAQRAELTAALEADKKVSIHCVEGGFQLGATAPDVRAAIGELADRETILDRLNVNTAGGIRDVLEAIHAIVKPVGAAPTSLTPHGRSD